MANVKKFVYVPSAEKWNTNSNDITLSTGKWYKSIVFRADTGEIWNRGKAYGVSTETASDIASLKTTREQFNAAKAALAAAKILNVITSESGETYTAGLSLGYEEISGQTGKFITLKGSDNSVLSSINVSDFIKDRFVDSAKLIVTESDMNLDSQGSAEGDKPDTNIQLPYIKLTFNDTAGTVRFSVKDLVDIYDGANLKLSTSYADKTDAYVAANVKVGASLDTVAAELKQGIAEAKAAGVTSFGTKTGAITLKATSTTDGDVNLTMSNNELQASVYGIANYAKKGDTITASDTEGYVTATLGGTVANPTIEVTEKTATLAQVRNDSTVTGLATAQDVWAVIEEDERVHAEALNELRDQIEAADGAAVKSVTKGTSVENKVTLTVDNTDAKNPKISINDSALNTWIGGVNAGDTKSDTNGNVSVSVSTANGKVSAVSVTATNAVYDATTNEFTTAGLVTSDVLQSVLDDLWEEL